MTSSRKPFELFAIRYATHDRRAADNFIGGDPHDVAMPLDYFVWVARSEEACYVIDTGFDTATANKRGRTLLRDPADGLRALAIDPADVRDVIVTHLHFDHIGNFHLFPAARFHLQEIEMAYATGRCMCHQRLRHPFDVDHVTGMVRRVYEGRVQFHNGDAEIAPGITVHLIGGHSRGLQCVRVWTERGWVVIASDASHLYAHFETGRPFPNVVRVDEMLDGYMRLMELATSPHHVIPGHDPLVMKRYAAPSTELEGICIKLHEPPQA